MYFVKYGKEYLHDPRVDGYVLLDLSLDCEENSCGYCDFTIYPNHPMYNKLKERDADNPIEVYDDDTLLFVGFIYELGKEFYLDGHVKCKGELDYLNESIVRPYSTVQRGYGSKAPATVNGYFEWLIEQHNAQVKPNKQFTVGINQGGQLVESNYIFRESNQYPTTIEEISEKLLNNFGGYIRTRHENGIRYIDYLSEWTDSNSQILDFGVNLTDYAQTDDADNLATFVVPLGARMSETEYEYDDGYFKTSDETMDLYKEYYTIPYNQCDKMAYFEDGVTYYERQVDTFATSDSYPIEGINYYTRSTDSEGNYIYTQQNISRFVSGVTYYEQEYYYTETLDKGPSDDKDYYIQSDSYSSVGNLGKFKKHDMYYEYDENEDESELPLTLDGLDDGEYDSPGYKKSKDMIYCESAVKKYGWIGVKYQDSDIFDKKVLLNAGTKALKELVSPKCTIEIKAVDMHLVNPDIKPIRVGEYVRVRSVPHNLDSYFLCRNISLDLNNPENSLYTLGTTFDTLTGQQNKRINALNETINKQYEAAAAISEEAKSKAIEASTTAKKASSDAANAKEVADSAVLSVVEEYAVSLNRVAVPTEGWSTETPSADDKYIWHRMVTTYGDGTVIVGEPALLTGPNGEDAVLLRIDSTRGTVFKNDSISTTLNVVIYNGPNRITNITDLHSVFGSGAYLQWYWQKVDDDSFGIISSSDSMISNDGFSLTISPEQVDTKVTFMCELII